MADPPSFYVTFDNPIDKNKEIFIINIEKNMFLNQVASDITHKIDYLEFFKSNYFEKAKIIKSINESIISAEFNRFGDFEPNINNIRLLNLNYDLPNFYSILKNKSESKNIVRFFETSNDKIKKNSIDQKNDILIDDKIGPEDFLIVQVGKKYPFKRHLPFTPKLIYKLDLKKLPPKLDLKQLVFVFIKKNFLIENSKLIHFFIDFVIKILKEFIFLKKKKDCYYIQIWYPVDIKSFDFGHIFYHYIKEKIKENKSYIILKKNNQNEWNTGIFVDNIRIFIDFLFINLNQTKAFALNLPENIQKLSYNHILIPTAILWNTISDSKIELSLDPLDYDYNFFLGEVKEKYQISYFAIQKIK
ncbi:hypothetical protein GVAV_001528 [Gurleya vavrai]